MKTVSREEKRRKISSALKCLNNFDSSGSAFLLSDWRMDYIMTLWVVVNNYKQGRVSFNNDLTYINDFSTIKNVSNVDLVSEQRPLSKVMNLCQKVFNKL